MKQFCEGILLVALTVTLCFHVESKLLLFKAELFKGKDKTQQIINVVKMPESFI